jgi:membrane associated rhomboid family serine protease
MARGGGSFLGDTRITRGALYLLAASGVVSLLYFLTGKETQLELRGELSASAYTLFHQGKIWTLVTSPLLQVQFISLLFQGLMLWLFVPALEKWWGMKKFLWFALYTSMAGVVGGSLVGLVLGGAHLGAPVSGLFPFVFASMLAFGILYANHPVRLFGAIPMTGRQMAIGVTVFTFAFIIIGQQWVEGGANAAAMLLAFALTSSRGSPKLWWLKWKQARIRRRLGVVDGGKKPQRWVN